LKHQPVFTLAEFCIEHRISRTRLYQEWNQGTGPDFFRVGTKILITNESAAAWRSARENAARTERASRAQVA
jgi:hypothetical protein